MQNKLNVNYYLIKETYNDIESSYVICDVQVPNSVKDLMSKLPNGAVIDFSNGTSDKYPNDDVDGLLEIDFDSLSRELPVSNAPFTISKILFVEG